MRFQLDKCQVKHLGKIIPNPDKVAGNEMLKNAKRNQAVKDQMRYEHGVLNREHAPLLGIQVRQVSGSPPLEGQLSGQLSGSWGGMDVGRLFPKNRELRDSSLLKFLPNEKVVFITEHAQSKPQNTRVGKVS